MLGTPGKLGNFGIAGIENGACGIGIDSFGTRTDTPGIPGTPGTFGIAGIENGACGIGIDSLGIGNTGTLQLLNLYTLSRSVPCTTSMAACPQE
jgi:hypothetical protein